MIRPATAADAHDFADRIAQEDKDEIHALTGLGPLEGFLWAHAESDESFAAVLESSGEVLAMWGVSRLVDSPAAQVWLICSPRVKEKPLMFQKTVKAALSELSSKCGLLVGYADTRNREHLTWVKRLGFEVRGTKKLGPGGHTFHEFAGAF